MLNDQINYFDSIRSHYAIYHNHKEVSAWAGLILHLIATGFIARVELPNSYEIATSVILSLFVLVISVLVYRHISNQLEMKDLGGANVVAALWFINQIMNENFSKAELDDIIRIEGTFEEQAQSKIVLPNALKTKAKQLNERARGFQDKTKNMIYGLLIVFTLLSLSSIWVKVVC